jgi:hypothetical protein
VTAIYRAFNRSFEYDVPRLVTKYADRPDDLLEAARPAALLPAQALGLGLDTSVHCNERRARARCQDSRARARGGAQVRAEYDLAPVDVNEGMVRACCCAPPRSGGSLRSRAHRA